MVNGLSSEASNRKIYAWLMFLFPANVPSILFHSEDLHNLDIFLDFKYIIILYNICIIRFIDLHCDYSSELQMIWKFTDAVIWLGPRGYCSKRDTRMNQQPKDNGSHIYMPKIAIVSDTTDLMGAYSHLLWIFSYLWCIDDGRCSENKMNLSRFTF